MNNTPRTEELLDRLGNNQILPNDNNAGGWSSIDMNAMIDFARQLERELNQIKDDADNYGMERDLQG